MTEDARLGQKFARAQQSRHEGDRAAVDADAEFAETGDDFFLDLAGHAGLLRAGMAGRVRIGVGRERAVLARRLVEADAVAHAVVEFSQTLDLGRVRAGLERREKVFLHRQQQLRNHVPVDAAEAFETEHAARAAGKRPVVEDLLEQGLQGLPRLPVCGSVERFVVRGNGVELKRQVAGVGELAAEAITAVGVALQNSVVFAREHRERQRYRLDALGGYPVFIQKARQFPVRIKHEGVLIGAVDVAGIKRLEDLDCLGRRERAGAERGNLAFQHRVERVDLDAAGLKIEQVVGMKQPVLAPAGGDAVVDGGKRVVQQVRDPGQRLCARSAQALLPVDGFAIAARCPSEGFEAAQAERGAHRSGAELGPDFAQRGRGLGKPFTDLTRQVDLAGLVGQYLLQEGEVTAQVIKRDHGQSLSDQRVVGVVPLGTLGIEPDTAVEHEVAELAQQRHQQLFQQVDLPDLARRVQQQLAVGAEMFDPGVDFARQLGVIDHRVLGVFEQGLERFDPVRHVGVAEHRFAQQGAQPIGVKRARQFEQFEQVNDLMIAPVTDIAPRIVGFLDLPVDTFLGDPVRVVAVRSRRVDELGDDAFDELGVTQRQRLPVLKYIPPVALVGQQAVAAGIPQPDREAVPRPARVAVAAAESDR